LNPPHALGSHTLDQLRGKKITPGDINPENTSPVSSCREYTWFSAILISEAWKYRKLFLPGDFLENSNKAPAVKRGWALYLGMQV